MAGRIFGFSSDGHRVESSTTFEIRFVCDDDQTRIFEVNRDNDALVSYVKRFISIKLKLDVEY